MDGFFEVANAGWTRLTTTVAKIGGSTRIPTMAGENAFFKPFIKT
jgi:hypothetical protein